MPELRYIEVAFQEYQVYHYRHIEEVLQVHTGEDPMTASIQYRSPNYLVCIVNRDGSGCPNAISFIHQGKRGELPYRIAPDLHGYSRGCIHSDGMVELAACGFNYMGADYPLRHLKFVRLFDIAGVSPLVGHRVRDPLLPLYREHRPWCVLHRVRGEQESRILADIQHMPAFPAPHEVPAQLRLALSKL